MMIPARDQHQATLTKEGNLRRRQKAVIPSETGNEIWLLTLSDLLMLLLIFFVLLFGLILHRQGPAAVAPPLLPANPVITASPAMTDSAPPEVIPGFAPAEAASSLEAGLVDLLGGNRGEQGVTVERRSHTIVVTLPERIIFDSGLSQLKPSVRPLLEKVTAFILGHPEVSIEIHGHTDDRPISNQRYPSNWELSAHRASQVAKALIERGILPQRLSIKGFGEYRPLVANDSDQNRLKNRRVEIQFSVMPPQS
ncbi:MAG: OmpA/MotB family protein [Syntrophales bacterium]